MTEEIQWYASINATTEGPFTEEQIKEKEAANTIQRDTLLWHKELGDWIPLRNIETFTLLQPIVEEGQPPEPPIEVKLTLGDYLNKVRMDNIALTGSIPLGDALERLAVAISRSGVRFDDMGNPMKKAVNVELGNLLLEALRRVPRTVDFQPVSLGYDPTRPMFFEGEAYSCPINSEMVMLLPKDKPPPVFPETDSDMTASPTKEGQTTPM